MIGNFCIVVAVKFEDIASSFVNDQTSNHVGPVKNPLQHHFGVTLLHKFFDRLLVCQNFKSLRPIQAQSIIHIKANGFNVFHIQRTITKYLAFFFNPSHNRVPFRT